MAKDRYFYGDFIRDYRRIAFCFGHTPSCYEVQLPKSNLFDFTPWKRSKKVQPSEYSSIIVHGKMAVDPCWIPIDTYRIPKETFWTNSSLAHGFFHSKNHAMMKLRQHSWRNTYRQTFNWLFLRKSWRCKITLNVNSRKSKTECGFSSR